MDDRTSEALALVVFPSVAAFTLDPLPLFASFSSSLMTREVTPSLIRHRHPGPRDASSSSAAERAAHSPPEGHICMSSGGGTLQV